MSDKLNPKFINFAGSAVLLLYGGMLRNNDGIDLFVLEQYQINQIIYASFHLSIIMVVLLKQVFYMNHRVLLPLNFYYSAIAASILMFVVRRLSTDSQSVSQWIWIGVYGLSIACLWYSVVVMYGSKLFTGQNDKDYQSDKKKQNRRKNATKNDKLFQSKNKTFKPLKKLTKVQQNDGDRTFMNVMRWAELHRIIIRNCVVWNVMWHTINICMLCNKYIFNKHVNGDNMMDIMWIYWTLEYINYQMRIIAVDNNVFAPYILIISLLISYDMFLLLRILPIFCVIVCLSTMAYRLSHNSNSNSNNATDENIIPQTTVVYATQNGTFRSINDIELIKVVESLPLDYLFSSLFSSFGVIMAPSIISVFWRVWHLIPLLINGPDHINNHNPICTCTKDLYQKTEIVCIQFIQSLFCMYVVSKEYNLYILWKYHRIFDIYSTLFILTLHAIISKLPFIIFSVCFFQYFVYGSDSCMNHEDEINPEMGTIKPPTPVLLIFYISFVINCWVVYYKFIWKHNDILYKSIKLCSSNFNLMSLMNENQFSMILFYKYDSLKIHIAATWVHFCGRVFSVFRNDTTIEIIHVITSIILVVSATYHHFLWQRKFNTHQKNLGYYTLLFLFACLTTLMFKLYVVRTVTEILLDYFGILKESWKHIRNIHIT